MSNEVLECDLGDYFEIKLVKLLRIVIKADNAHLLRIRHYSYYEGQSVPTNPNNKVKPT